jgi:hypothetical protein
MPDLLESRQGVDGVALSREPFVQFEDDPSQVGVPGVQLDDGLRQIRLVPEILEAVGEEHLGLAEDLARAALGTEVQVGGVGSQQGNAQGHRQGLLQGRHVEDGQVGVPRAAHALAQAVEQGRPIQDLPRQRLVG